MSSDVFVISSVRHANAATAIRQSAEAAGVSLGRFQDTVFGLGASSPFELWTVDSMMEAAGLSCPWVAVSSPLRALSFSAAAILGEDASLSVVVGLEKAGCPAIVLASPEIVALLNLLPRARLAARSISGAETALRLAALNSSDIQLSKEGDSLVLLHGLLDELDEQGARWGLVSSAGLGILIERI